MKAVSLGSVLLTLCTLAVTPAAAEPIRQPGSYRRRLRHGPVSDLTARVIGQNSARRSASPSWWRCGPAPAATSRRNPWCVRPRTVTLFVATSSRQSRARRHSLGFDFAADCTGRAARQRSVRLPRIRGLGVETSRSSSRSPRRSPRARPSAARRSGRPAIWRRRCSISAPGPIL